MGRRGRFLGSCGVGVLLTVGLGSSTAPAAAEEAADAGEAEGTCGGRWSGAVDWRGTPLPVRLVVVPGPEGPSASLDIPQLVYAGVPVPIAETATGCAVELPFGLGEVPLVRAAGALSGSRELAGETLRLELAPDRSPPLVRQEVSFPGARSAGGGVDAEPAPMLAGTLVLPPGPGPHPAVVLLHGSAATDRTSWGYRSWAEAFADRGVAAMVFDRRGSGSDGPPPDLAVLAADARAAVAFLRGRPGIDPGGVGLSGGSQGGWVALAAAEGDPAVAFLVLRATPAVTPAEQEVQRVVAEARSGGLGEEAVEEARNYLRLYFYVAHTGRAWDELALAAAEAGGRPWGELVDQPQSLADLGWWRRNHHVSPHAAAAGVTAPVLAFYGSADGQVPAAENAEPMRRLLAEAGVPAEVVVYPGADHRLEVPPGRDDDGAWRWFSIAPGLLDRLDAWLAPHLAPAEVNPRAGPP